MSSRKPKRKRPVASYLASAKELATFAPSLAKYKRRKTLTRYEKAAITRKEKLLRYTDKLVPVTKQQAKELKEFLYIPEKYDPKTHIKTPVYNSGIRAIRLANTADQVKLTIRHQRSGKLKLRRASPELMLESNGRNWLYQTIKQVQGDKRGNKRKMREAATMAFTSPADAFPLERIAELAEKAFRRTQTKEIYLWTEQGRVGEGFATLDEFIRWLDDEWLRYRDTHKWVHGIAVRLTN